MVIRFPSRPLSWYALMTSTAYQRASTPAWASYGQHQTHGRSPRR